MKENTINCGKCAHFEIGNAPPHLSECGLYPGKYVLRVSVIKKCKKVKPIKEKDTGNAG